MLREEGNAGERWKTTMGLISKKEPLHVQHTFFWTFLCRCFARLQRETSWNVFMEEMSYVFSFTFFSPALNFFLHLWPIAFLILSPPLQNFAIPFELPYLLIELFYIGMPVLRTDGRAYCHVITKFSRSSLRARAPLKSRNYRKSGILGNRVIYL